MTPGAWRSARALKAPTTTPRTRDCPWGRRLAVGGSGAAEGGPGERGFLPGRRGGDGAQGEAQRGLLLGVLGGRKGVPWGWECALQGPEAGDRKLSRPALPRGRPRCSADPRPWQPRPTRARASAEEAGSALGASGRRRQTRGGEAGAAVGPAWAKAAPRTGRGGAFGRARGSTGRNGSSDPRALGGSGEGRRLLPGGTREPQKVFAGGMLAVLAGDKFSEFGFKNNNARCRRAALALVPGKLPAPGRAGGRVGLLKPRSLYKKEAYEQLLQYPAASN